jgi:hypothetical protein
MCLIVAIAALLLQQLYRARVLGILPYLLLAVCPVIHLFMHGRHAGHHDQDARRP